MELKDETILLPGHFEITSIGEERKKINSYSGRYAINYY
jgi:hypothetical protein